ncbi:MAG: YraN family protein [Clostridia bacterium]|nr:YraN family protein [Clostridia bacterium]
MNNIFLKGKNAELMVAAYLRKHGCIIAKMNYHSRFGEIDIIAETKSTIMFVEVKMRGQNSIMAPAEAVDAAKQRKIVSTANDFLLKSHLTGLQPRFDVAEVFEETLPNGKKRYKINYIKNAF